MTADELRVLQQAAYDRLLALMPQAGVNWSLDGEKQQTHLEGVMELQQMLVAMQGPWRRRQHVRSVDGPAGAGRYPYGARFYPP